MNKDRIISDEEKDELVDKFFEMMLADEVLGDILIEIMFGDSSDNQEENKIRYH